MAECKPERRFKRLGGEVWSCKCGTLGVTFNGVTVRYSPKDFKRLLRLMHLAEHELLGDPSKVQPPQADGSVGGSGNTFH